MDLEAARLGIKITFAHETEPLGKIANRIIILFLINSKFPLILIKTLINLNLFIAFLHERLKTFTIKLSLFF